MWNFLENLNDFIDERKKRNGVDKPDVDWEDKWRRIKFRW